MNAKRVSFSDINDILTIPRVEGTKKLMFPWKNERVLYSEEALEEQIQKRRENAIRETKKKFMKLEKQYNDGGKLFRAKCLDEKTYCSVC